MLEPDIILIAHNLRSCHNVGSILRTAEGIGVSKVYLTGYTPYPLASNDTRIPHEARKLAKQINKTALGAEDSQPWEHIDGELGLIKSLQQQGFIVAAIEQAPTAKALPSFAVPPKIALLVGREVEGVEPEVLLACDQIVEIPMFGKKESFNVVQATAMALYHCRFIES